jgi:quaternary ammonium compound-resistance protein SugE
VADRRFVTIVAMLASVGLFSVSMRTLPLGTAYTMRTGFGVVGTFIAGVAILDRSRSGASWPHCA